MLAMPEAGVQTPSPHIQSPHRKSRSAAQPHAPDRYSSTVCTPVHGKHTQPIGYIMACCWAQSGILKQRPPHSPHAPARYISTVAYRLPSCR